MENLNTSLRSGLEHFNLKHFQLATLVVESQVLRGNPLSDSNVRRNPVLIPVDPVPAGGWPVVLVLAGFTGNGPNYFNIKSFESNFAQVLDRCTSAGEAVPALYIFCDAMTYWGGSQFINSTGTGRYEDFIISELVEVIRRELPSSKDAGKWCVMGGSSGGYGALHLASRRPDIFGLCAAIAPDSFFEASLLPEIWKAWPIIEKAGGIAGIQAEFESGRLMKRREAHSVLNAVAMGVCYAPDGNGGFRLPIHPETGVLDDEIWRDWKAHDPIVFLEERASNVSRLARIFLDVGVYDQFHLQFGARQIRHVLQRIGAKVDDSEFEGTHFEIGDRRPEVWKWLRRSWTID